jgi:hypothetical protein
LRMNINPPCSNSQMLQHGRIAASINKKHGARPRFSDFFYLEINSSAILPQ